MTAARGVRDLAQRLLTYELGADNSSERMESPALRVYEKLRQSLGEFVGVAGFQSLASRALTLARLEAPGLGTVRINSDGSLQGMGKIEAPMDSDKDRAGDEGMILIACLLELLRVFLGEALTLCLLRNAWPDEAFDNRNSAHERKT
jgi:hypothetical protein